MDTAPVPADAAPLDAASPLPDAAPLPEDAAPRPQDVPTMVPDAFVPVPLPVLSIGEAGRMAATKNAGRTWRRIESPTDVDLMSIECGGGVCLLVASDDRMWRTADLAAALDAGAGSATPTWSEVVRPPLEGVPTETPYLNRWHSLGLSYLGGRWFMGASARIYISDDGETWRSVFYDPSLVGANGKDYTVRSFARVGDDLVATTAGEGYPYVIFSPDGGETWPVVTRSDDVYMPGSGADCAIIWAVADERVFWTLGWSYCDSIAYSPADLWIRLPDSDLSWRQMTLEGALVQAQALGTDGRGQTLTLGGMNDPTPYACDAWMLTTGETLSVGRLPDGIVGECGHGRIVFAQNQWWAPLSSRLGGVVGAQPLVLVGAADASEWHTSDTGFRVFGVGVLR